MTGNAFDAALALSEYRANSRRYVFSADGSSRMVYLIDGVIYKVDIIAGTNADEYDIMLNMRDSLPMGVFYPEVSLFTVSGVDVIAMEYIEGTAIYACVCADMGDKCDSVCMTPQESVFLPPLLNDPSGMNIIRNEHGYYIIDAN